MAAAGDALTTVGDMIADPVLLDADPPEVDDWLALPGFDEYMLGYKDRSLLFSDPAHFEAVVPGGNGIFRSTIVRNGVVVATWNRALGKKAIVVTVQPLVKLGAADHRHVTAALTPYADFVGLPLDVR